VDRKVPAALGDRASPKVIGKEVAMSPDNPTHDLGSQYDVQELPSLEAFDVDLESYRQAFIEEMSRWEGRGYDAIGVTSLNGRLMGFFKKRTPG
jgi:hypothetical protein